MQVVSALGASDIDARLEEVLIDGILFAFQEQVGEEVHRGVGVVLFLSCPEQLGNCVFWLDKQEVKCGGAHPCPCNTAVLKYLQVTDDANVMLNGFGTVVNALGRRAKPYLSQICGTIKWRLNNKAAKIRQQAADLIARIAPVMKTCDEEQLLGHLGEWREGEGVAQKELTKNLGKGSSKDPAH